MVSVRYALGELGMHGLHIEKNRELDRETVTFVPHVLHLCHTSVPLVLSSDRQSAANQMESIG